MRVGGLVSALRKAGNYDIETSQTSAATPLAPHFGPVSTRQTQARTIRPFWGEIPTRPLMQTSWPHWEQATWPSNQAFRTLLDRRNAFPNVQSLRAAART